MATPSPNELLNTITEDYLPRPTRGLFTFLRDRPIFTLHQVLPMMSDPRVIFGLWLIKGPILSNSKFFVKTEDPKIKEYLVNTINRFWRNSAARALTAIEWGFSPHEVLYRTEQGLIHFDTLKELQPLDCRAIVKKGKFVGISVKGSRTQSQVTEIQNIDTYVGGPKAFWHVHWRDKHPFYGRSRLFAAHLPWWEKWTDGGYRDIRRLFHHKYAFDGGTLYHPTGIYRNEQSGETVPYKDLARRMIEAKKTGGTYTLPNTMNDGVRAWEPVPPNAPPGPTGLEEYGNQLDQEILEGLCVPPEVAQAEGTGAFAGRRIPQQAFFAILQELVQWLISDADVQIFQPLIELNFGIDHAPYEIMPFGLIHDAEQETPGAPEDGQDQIGPEGQQLSFAVAA